MAHELVIAVETSRNIITTRRSGGNIFPGAEISTPASNFRHEGTIKGNMLITTHDPARFLEIRRPD